MNIRRLRWGVLALGFLCGVVLLAAAGYGTRDFLASGSCRSHAFYGKVVATFCGRW